jgi:adenosylcobinamide-GDP ribazoletransferase
VLATGAFHEDGLADVADAFGGGVDREDRLRILKDPRLGTYGVLAISVSLLVRAGSVAGLGRTAAFLALPAVHALSRAAAVGAMVMFEPINEGLGATYTQGMKRGTALAGVLIGLAIAVLLIGPWAAAGAVVVFAEGLVIGRLAKTKIGGINGDVLGAIQQVSEISLLVIAAALVHASSRLGW